MKLDRIFLSYRSLESDFALRVAGDLKKAGVRVWMDRLDGDVGIHVGMDWRDTIKSALNSCAALIAILSPGYVQSKYCLIELALADRLGLRIYPLLLERYEAKDTPLEIERIQYIDFTATEKDPETYERGIAKLIARLRAEVPEQIGEAADEERRYLIDLITELESRRGVQEYVELRGKTSDVRPRPMTIDEWGYSELITPDRQKKDEGPREIPLHNIKDALEIHQRFVLVGEPGAGKTTTIRRLARLTAQARMDNPRTAPLPMIVYLSQWDEAAEFEDLLLSQWPFDVNPLPLIANGDIWLYLDGLNEIGAGAQHKMQQLHAWLHGETQPQRVIITSRRDDYDDQLGLPKVAITPLDIEQVQEFAHNYLEDRAEGFLKRVFATPTEGNAKAQLTDLVRNPYLLGALIYIYQESPTQELPRNNGDLSKRLAQALWRREEQRKTPGWIPFEAMAGSLSGLAFDMIDAGRPTEVPLDYAVEKLRERGLLRWKWRAHVNDLLYVTQRANLLEQRGRYVRFYHQLLQEYFAALQLIDMGVEGRIEPLTATGVSGVRMAKKWDQVVIAACGLNAEQADNLVCQTATLDPCLAVDCLGSGITVSDSTREAVRKQVERCIDDMTNWRIRKVAVSAAAQIDDLELLHRAARDFDINVRLEALDTIARYRDAASIPVLVENLGFRDAGIRGRAISALANYEDDALEPLYTLLAGAHDTTRSRLIELLGSREAGWQRLIQTVELTESEKETVLRELAHRDGGLNKLLAKLPTVDKPDRKPFITVLKGLPSKKLSKLINREGLFTAEERNALISVIPLDVIEAAYEIPTDPQEIKALVETMYAEPDLKRRAMLGRVLSKAGDPRTGVGLGADGLPDIDWVLIPAGKFKMGHKDEKDNPPRVLTLPYHFQIARYPVTYAQFQTFITDTEGAGDYRWWEGIPERSMLSLGYAYPTRQIGEQSFKYANHPRENVNWYQVIAFCRWLSWRLGGGYALDAINDWAVRLPTEFEWEKAARANTGWTYPYGYEFDAAKDNTGKTGIEQTSAVGIFPDGDTPHWSKPISDLSGNVWEWCLTDYDNPQVNAVQENISSTTRRVLRGGSWSSDHLSARAASRNSYNPNLRNFNLGFRLLRAGG